MSSSSLTRLIYASRRNGVGDLDAEVQNILIASINNNRRTALTGLLIAHADWFLQALEGPETAVTDTFGRISADPRHSCATVLDIARPQSRSFYRWTMCARTMSDADELIVGNLVEAPDFDPFTASPGAAFGLLSHIAELHADPLTMQHTDLLNASLRSV